MGTVSKELLREYVKEQKFSSANDMIYRHY